MRNADLSWCQRWCISASFWGFFLSRSWLLTKLQAAFKQAEHPEMNLCYCFYFYMFIVVHSTHPVLFGQFTHRGTMFILLCSYVTVSSVSSLPSLPFLIITLSFMLLCPSFPSLFSLLCLPNPLQSRMAVCSWVCAQLCCGHGAEGRGRRRGAVQAGAAVWLGSEQAGQLCEENRSHHQDPAAPRLPWYLQDR